MITRYKIPNRYLFLPKKLRDEIEILSLKSGKKSVYKNALWEYCQEQINKVESSLLLNGWIPEETVNEPYTFRYGKNMFCIPFNFAKKEDMSNVIAFLIEKGYNVWTCLKKQQTEGGYYIYANILHYYKTPLARCPENAELIHITHLMHKKIQDETGGQFMNKHDASFYVTEEAIQKAEVILKALKEHYSIEQNITIE